MHWHALPRITFGLLASTSLAMPVWGQVETDLDVEGILAVALLDDSDANRDAEPFLGEISMSPRVEYVLENSAEIGVRGSWRFQIDHPQRSGFTGSVGACSASAPGCPSTAIGESPISGFGRLSANGGVEDGGPRASLESAFVYVDGGWGEIAVGLDQGIGHRFTEGGPSTFSHTGASDPLLDPSGLNVVRSDNNVTGGSAKVAYATPRLLGIRLGASYAPVANHRGLDLDLSERPRLGRAPKLKDVIEMGVQAGHVFRSSGLRVNAGLTHAEASVDTPGFSDFTSTGFGVDISRRDQFRVGVKHVVSNNGSVGEGDYTATHFGSETYFKDWTFAAEYAVAQDDLVAVRGENWSLGASHPWGDRSEISVGYQSIRSEISDSTGFASNKVMRESHGLIVEFKIRH